MLMTAGMALASVGCAANDEERMPRPPVPIPVSVVLDREGARVSPERIAIPGQVPININQNANAGIGQARQVEDSTVVFTVSNQSNTPERLILEGPVEKVERIPARGTSDFQVAMPTGIYRLASTGGPGTDRLTVGPSRVSSGTSVLTP